MTNYMVVKTYLSNNHCVSLFYTKLHKGFVHATSLQNMLESLLRIYISVSTEKKKALNPRWEKFMHDEFEAYSRDVELGGSKNISRSCICYFSTDMAFV